MVDLGTGRTAVALAAGSTAFTCAILDDGSVKCWGVGFQAQLGQGGRFSLGDDPDEMGDNLPPIQLGTGRTAIALTAGENHVCALLDDGALKCWGDNDDGQLGLGDSDDRGDTLSDMGDALPEVDMGTGRTAVAVAAGQEFTCAILDDNSVKCWGDAGFTQGKLGLGDQVDRGDDPGEMGDPLPALDLGTALAPVAVRLGEDHGCVRFSDGSVKCWGDNGQGRLGIEDNSAGRGWTTGQMGTNLPFVDLGSGRTAVDLQLGAQTSCALLDDDTVKCWGDSTHGQIGQETIFDIGRVSGDMGDDLPAINLGTGRTAASMLMRYQHVCAIRDDDNVACWGDNQEGEFGIGTSTATGDRAGEMGDSLDALQLDAVAPPLQVVTGGAHSCALLADGDVQCWGDNVAGQLGLGDTLMRGEDAGEMGASLPRVDLDGAAVIDLAAGQEHTCALRDDDAVQCWGENDRGQLGLGDTDRRGDDAMEMGASLPTVDLGAGVVVSLVAGWAHTCALFADGSVKCWGENFYGQLGLGDQNDRGIAPTDMGVALPAVDLGPGRTAMQITAGSRFNCALLDDDSVKCWGHNTDGQLGQRDEEERGDDMNEMGASLLAIDLGTGLTPVEVRAGDSHACARMSDGRVKCWGNGASGALGSGSQADLGDAPGEMGDALPWVDLGTNRTTSALSLGAYFSCALLDGDRVKCWGRNFDGQLGLEDDDSRGGFGVTMGDVLPEVYLRF